MKKWLPVLLMLMGISTISCKKTVEDKKIDLLVKAMTDGVWLVDLYTDGGTDITTDFQDYEFQFLEDGTVMGTNSAGMTHGTWVGDINTQTITSNFPGAPHPLSKLNGTWKITDSYLDYVKSETGTGTSKQVLHLKKKV